MFKRRVVFVFATDQGDCSWNVYVASIQHTPDVTNICKHENNRMSRNKTEEMETLVKDVLHENAIGRLQ